MRCALWYGVCCDGDVCKAVAVIAEGSCGSDGMKRSPLAYSCKLPAVAVLVISVRSAAGYSCFRSQLPLESVNPYCCS